MINTMAYRPELFRTAGAQLRGRTVSVPRSRGLRGTYYNYFDDPNLPDDNLIYSGGSDWVSTVKELAPTAQLLYNSQRVFDTNLDRAARGLPPINPSLAAPTVNFGLDANTQRLLLIAGAVLLGVVLLKGKRAA